MDLCDRLLADLEARFWAKVEKTDECWLWLGAGSVYGHLKVAGRDVGAHVLAYELGSGEPIPEGAVVMHTCDTPKCVRFAHLVLATQSDNIRDMWAKGRDAEGSSAPEKRVRGEQHGCSKLTEEQVLEARRLYAQGGIRLVDLAERFSVGRSTIHDAITGKKWGYLPLPPDHI